MGAGPHKEFSGRSYICSFEETVGFVAIERLESALLGGIDTDLWRPLDA